MSTAIAAGAGLVTLLLTVLVAGLLRSHADIIRALHDLGVNLDPAQRAESALLAPGPRPRPVAALGASVDITGTDLDGGAVKVAVTGVPRRTLLAFLSSTCTTCRGFWDALGEPEIPVPAGARLVIVVRDRQDESPSALSGLAAPHVPTVHSTDAWASYGVPGAPYFVLVDGPAGRIAGEGTATSWTDVKNLLEQAVADETGSGGRARAGAVDRTLRAAGIEPGDPSLYPGRQP